MAFIPQVDRLALPILNYVWDPNTMAWVVETQPGGGGGGGGGTSSNFGAAFPTAGTAVGFKDQFGNMVPITLQGAAGDSVPTIIKNQPVVTLGAGSQVAITDGVNGDVTVKQPNVPAGVGDSALVVALQPASPLPAGTNVIGHVIVNTAPTTAVTVADGADVAEGAVADVKVVGDAAGTISAKLRGINTELAEIALDTDNLDVALSTRLKPADTLTKVATVDTITNPVDVSDRAGRSLGIVNAIRSDNNASSVSVVTTPSSVASPVMLATSAFTGGVIGGNPVGGGSDTISANGYSRTWTGMPGSRVQITMDGSVSSGITVNFFLVINGITVPWPMFRLDTGTQATSFTFNNEQAVLETYWLPNSSFKITSSAFTSGSINYLVAYDATPLRVRDISDRVARLLGHVTIGGGAKGATTAADVTSTAQSADRQALDVQVRTSTGAVVDTFGTPLPSTSTSTRITPAWRQDVQLLAANASRKEGVIVNLTDAPLYLKEGSGASDVSFNAIVPPRGRYTFDVTTAIDAWWNVVTTDGFVQVTERA